jgi:hypothetical protein
MISAALTGCSNSKRATPITQYARALNSSYITGYSAGTVVLAQQLLLALSPLHAQLLPRPETAFMVPSAFPAAVGKALQGYLLDRPVLDAFQHQQAQLTSWHVYWHMGLRQYAARQQQQQQQQSKPGKGSSSSSSRFDASSMNAAYLDPDARCGFCVVLIRVFLRQPVCLAL